MKRRQFLTTSSAALVSVGVLAQLPARRAFAQAEVPLRLSMPPLLDTRTTGRLALTTRTGSTSFLAGQPTPTAGFNQSYLGPTIVV